MKKILSLLLVICMVASMAALLPAFAVESTPEGEEIVTAEDFINMAVDGTYYLGDNIDFSEYSFPDGHIAPSGFYGTLDGNGFSLTGITIESGSDTGVFGTFFHGTVKNLTIGSPEDYATITCTGGGKAVGAVVASLQGGDSTFENVTVYANVTGNDNKSGMFGGFVGTGHTINLTNCKTYGSISGGPVSGFIVTLQGDASTYNFTNCQNNADVVVSVNNATPCGGFFAVAWEGSTENVHTFTFTNCVNNGDVTAKLGRKDRGCASGFIGGNKNLFDAEFTNCTNNGTITGDDGSAAGFVVVRRDGLYGAANTHEFVLTGCVNNGTIQCNNNDNDNLGSSAGLVALPASVETTNLTMTNCINTGNVIARRGSAGGLFTLRNDSNSCFSSTIHATITGCVNTGTVTAQDWRAGGIIGMYGAHATTTLTMRYCYNSGKISNPGQTAAGIAGELAQTNDCSENKLIENCYNIGTLDGNTRPEIARIGSGGQQNFNTVRNSFYLTGNETYATWGDVTATNNLGCADAEELLAKLTEVKIDDSPVQFVADTVGINGGYPILSWQLPESVGAPAFSAGSMSFADSKYTISTEGVTGYISARVNGDKSDLRFVLAADMEAIKAYEDLSVTVEFCDVTGVVKSFTLGFDALTFYKEAVGAGNTYVAAEGDALFGLVVTDVPNDAWSYVILKVNTSAETAMAGKATASSTINP